MEDFGKISVLMGVYNCEDTLEQAIQSIIEQTYTNWELILCDDGSTDNTYKVAKRIADRDSRIVLLKNSYNMGLNKTLNKCLSVASGKYIARMDGDDISVENRFEIQIKYLSEHPEIDIVSSPMFLFDQNGIWGETKSMEYPQVTNVVIGSPICHAPVLMKKECMDKVNGYTENERMLRVEDVNLWIKLYAAGYRCYNIQTPLYKMRNDENALNRRKYKYRVNSTYVRLLGCKEFGLGTYYYLRAFGPMIIGLIPAKFRNYIKHKIQ